MFIFGALANAFAGSIRNLCDVHAVAKSGLHHDVQRLFVGIIGYVSTDPERNLGSAVEIILDFCRFLEVQAVAEKERFGFRIDPERFVMLNHLVAPLVRVSAVVSDTAEQR